MLSVKSFTCPQRFHRVSPLVSTRSATIAKSYEKPEQNSIAIIGAGSVGSCIASSLIHRNIVKNIYIDDINKEFAEGVVYDLEDEAFITGTNIHLLPSYDVIRDHCEIVIITAGVKQKPGEPRSELIQRNAKVLNEVYENIRPESNPYLKVIVVSNPVDVLTQVFQEWTDGSVPRNQIIGSGTYLDTQRTRVALAKHLGVSPKNVHSYVIGEHGDSQVFARSASYVAGRPLSSFPQITAHVLDQIAQDTKRKAYEIIKRKGSTSHGIGECVASICESIVLDKKEIMPVSCWSPELKTCLGWPAVIGKNGIEERLTLHLSLREHEALLNSADIVKRLVYATMFAK